MSFIILDWTTCFCKANYTEVIERLQIVIILSAFLFFETLTTL